MQYVLQIRNFNIAFYKACEWKTSEQIECYHPPPIVLVRKKVKN